MRIQIENREKNLYKSTDDKPMIFRLEIVCEGTYNETLLIEKAFKKMLKEKL